MSSQEKPPPEQQIEMSGPEELPHAKTNQSNTSVTQAPQPAPPPPTRDAVWGELGEDSLRYRNPHWAAATVLLVKIQIGLGVLGLPTVMNALGLVPGFLAIAGLGLLTTWSASVFARFKHRNQEIYTVADVGYVMWGTSGREIVGAVYWVGVEQSQSY